MLSFVEFLTGFYWPLIFEALFGTFRRARWRRAINRYGPFGILTETVESVIGTNTYAFFVPLEGQWDGRSIARLLKQFDIEMWGWGFWNHEFFFHVRIDDALFAQDILLSAGVELLG